MLDAPRPYQGLNKVRQFEHDFCDRRRLQETLAKSRVDNLVFQVSQNFPISSSEASKSTKTGKHVAASTTTAVPQERNHTPTVFDVDMETPAEPFKPFFGQGT